MTLAGKPSINNLPMALVAMYFSRSASRVSLLAETILRPSGPGCVKPNAENRTSVIAIIKANNIRMGNVLVINKQFSHVAQVVNYNSFIGGLRRLSRCTGERCRIELLYLHLIFANLHPLPG